jgi:carbon-monoxide dehydrogenase large subunit
LRPGCEPAGQSHGGIAQGIGQALWEQCVYEPRSGQLLSGSLLDYALPRADLLPRFDTEISEVPSATNPLGMRGGSEGGIDIFFDGTTLVAKGQTTARS